MIVLNQFQGQESSLIYIGVDVGLRTAFTFSNGLKFNFSIGENAKTIKEIKTLFDNFFARHFSPIERYHFFFENYLLTKKMEDPSKKSTSYWRKKIKYCNDIVDYCLKKYSDRITFVDSCNSSKECSECGFVAHENVIDLCGFGKNKVFRCILCKKSLDRDLNASIVLLKRGLNGQKDL